MKGAKTPDSNVIMHKIASELTNKSEQTDLTIKNFLTKLLENNTPLSLAKIAEQLGITADILHHRIYAQKGEIKELWDKVKIANRDKSSDINNQIKLVLEDAVKSQKPIKINDIAKKVGLNRAACNRRIFVTPELKELWDKTEKLPKSVKSDEALGIEARIKEFLENAILNNLTVLTKDIANVLGIKNKQVSDRIRRTPVLKELWDKLEHYKMPKKNDKSKEKDLVVKNILEFALKENQKLSLAEVAKRTGFTIPDCHHRIHRNQEIKELWNKVTKTERSKRENVLRGEKREVVINKVQSILEEAQKEGKILTFKELAKKCKMRESAIHHMIYGEPRLFELWTEIGHGETLKYKSQKLNSQIANVLQRAIKENTPLLLEDIARELNSTVPTVKGRIREYGNLQTLWDKTPRKKVYIEPKTSVEKTEKIRVILENIIKENRPVMLKELAEEIGWEYLVLRNKINRTPVLTELWKQIDKKTISNDSINIKENIKQVLNSAIETKTFVSPEDIAKNLGITYSTCIQRLNKDSELLSLWKQVQAYKNDDLQKLDNQIKEILENCIKTNSSITYNELINKTGVSYATFAYRLNQSSELKDLWKQIKANDSTFLKQFHNLKKNNVKPEEIKKELNLTEEDLIYLNGRYELIKSNLLKRFGDYVPEEDIFNWAFLSKREFELAVNELFAKIGYKSKTTRYSGDNGVDVVAQKDGKKIFIECMHNLFNLTQAEELLTLQGNKHYYDADNVIYVATTGITSYGQKFVNKIGSDFKILTLKDIIKLAKKYNVDVTKLKEKENINVISAQNYGGNWVLPTKADFKTIEKLKKMNPAQFEKTVLDMFISKGYKVEKAEELNLEGYYIVTKDNHKSLIKCHNQNTSPTLDSIKALYGMRDFYETDDVILIGASSITGQSKGFIDTINKRAKTKDTYKLYSLDRILETM